MHPSRKILLVTGIVSLFVTAPRLVASGAYVNTPANPPSEADAASRARYDNGKAVFNGKFTPADAPSAAAEAALRALQERLPKSAAKGVDLVALAGKIDEKQLEDLRYFMAVRYKISS